MGKDTEHCGNNLQPCRTLHHVITISRSEDEIHLTSQSELPEVFDFCTIQPITKDLTLIGTNMTAVLNCPREKNTEIENVTIGFKNIIFRGINFRATDVNLKFQNCTFTDSTILLMNSSYENYYQNSTFKATDLLRNLDTIYRSQNTKDLRCRKVSLHMEQVRFENSIFKSQVEYWYDSIVREGVQIICDMVDVNIINTFLVNNRVSITAFSEIKMKMEHTVLTGSTTNSEIHHNLNGLKIRAYTMPSILIRHCRFVELRYSNLVDAFLFAKVHMAAINVVVISCTTNQKTNTNVSILIENTVFDGNYGAITFDINPQCPAKAAITRCQFRNNVIMTDGAALYVHGTAPSMFELQIKSSFFFNNTADGKIVVSSINAVNSTFLFGGRDAYVNNVELVEDDNSAHVHLKLDEGHKILTEKEVTMYFSGNGGAIFATTANIVISNCTFVANDAAVYGGTVYVSKHTNLTIINSTLETSPWGNKKVDGIIIASSGKSLHLINVILRQHQLTSDFYSVLYHEGGSFEATGFLLNFSLQCPPNANAKENIVSAGILQMAELRRMKGYQIFGTLLLNCVPCPVNTYSLERASLQYTSSTTTTHVTMESGLVDMATNITIKNVICHKCPFQGKCMQDGVKPKKNHWAIIKNGQVIFHRCPESYCCSNDSCDTSYNYCNPHRIGTLCGHCESNYSESLDSALCIPNENCRGIWKLVQSCCFISTLHMLVILLSISAHINGSSKMSRTNVQGGDRMDKIISENPIADDSTQTQQTNALSVSKTFQKHMATAGNANSKEDVNIRLEEYGSAYLMILFYHIQDASIIHTVTYKHIKSENAFLQFVKDRLFGFFLFTLKTIYSFDTSPCFLPNTKPVLKVLLQMSVFFVTFTVLVILRIIVSMTTRIKAKLIQNFTTTANQRTSAMIILFVLISYQRIIFLLLPLIRCTVIDDQKVLILDGNLSCYANWQILLSTYLVLCLIPLPFYLTVCIFSLETSTLLKYYVGCAAPLPLFIFSSLANFCYQKKPSNSLTRWEKSNAATSTWNVLQGPYRQITVNILKHSLHICWTGVVLIRRSLLVMFDVFLDDPLTKVTLCRSSLIP